MFRWLRKLRRGATLSEVYHAVCGDHILRYRRQLVPGVFVFEDERVTVTYVKGLTARARGSREIITVVMGEFGGELVIRVLDGNILEEIEEQGRSHRYPRGLVEVPMASGIVAKVRHLVGWHTLPPAA